MKISGYDYFKPSIRNGVYGMLFLVIPMGGFGYLLFKQRQEQEAKYRRGEVAYKDRYFKFA